MNETTFERKKSIGATRPGFGTKSGGCPEEVPVRVRQEVRPGGEGVRQRE